MAATFQSGPDWAQNLNPLLNRQVLLADIWPQGGAKDALADGDHPILAVGPTTLVDGRPNQMVGVVVSFESVSGIVVMNFGFGIIVLQDVANVLTYAAGVPDTFDTSLNFGRAVYVDDSAGDLGVGTTLSLSPQNDADVKNPLAGYLWRKQTEVPDTAIGGDNVDPYPITVANSLVETNLAVLLVGAGNHGTT